MPETTTPETTVRVIAGDDHAAWLPLWQEYLRFYRAEIPDAVVRETWRRLLDPAEPVRGAMAFRGGAAIGLVHHITHRSCWTIGDYCHLQDLLVTEGARGSGAGRMLIEHVCRWAKAAGCSRVHWLTQEANHTAQILYDRVAERSGFVQYRVAF